MLTVTLGGRAIGVHDPLYGSHARGVWGHAPPENFEIFYPLK